MNLKTKLKQTLKLINQINPLSIIIQGVTDIDIGNFFKNKYSVVLMEKSMSWNKFLSWFHSISHTRSILEFNQKRIIIINTDMITRIPKEKTAKAKAKETSVHNFIKFITLKMKTPVILTTEKPKKDYKAGK